MHAVNMCSLVDGLVLSDSEHYPQLSACMYRVDGVEGAGINLLLVMKRDRAREIYLQLIAE